MIKTEIMDKYKQLPIIIDSLNDKGLEIINTNNSIAQNKKVLMQLTREKSKNLIKEYQAEIDLLVNRLRQTQSWFLDLYKLVKTLPDPIPLITDFSKEIESLSTDRARLQDELAKTSTLKEDGQKLLVLNDEYNANISMLKEQEYALQRQVNLLTAQLQSISSQHEVDKKVTAAELLELKQKLQAKIAQADLLGSDLKMSSLQLEKNQAVIKQLSEQLLHAKQEGMDSLHQEHLNELNALNTQLLNQKSHFESLLHQANQQSQAELEMSKDAFLRQISKLNKENEDLCLALKDYNTCKMELEIFKSNLNVDADNLPLESLLINKNKQLENEYTEIKQKYSVLEVDMQNHLTKYADLHKLTVNQTALIKKLENDIRSLEQKPINAIEKVMLEPMESNSIIPILTSQRDRFKQRFEDSEATVKQLEAAIAQMQYENQNLKQDNVKLYESKRYVEQYQDSKKRYSGDVESRYKAAYEQENDPFRLFKIEQERQFLNPAERLLKQVLSNRISRLIFLMYALGLHLLVFFTLFELIELK